jgi:hypothetical protein
VSEKKPYRIEVLHSTSHYRGDHAADVLLAVMAEPWETIGQVVLRTLAEDQTGAFQGGDHLQVRISECTEAELERRAPREEGEER